MVLAKAQKTANSELHWNRRCTPMNAEKTHCVSCERHLTPWPLSKREGVKSLAKAQRTVNCIQILPRIGKLVEESTGESPSPALPHWAVQHHRGKGDFITYIIVNTTLFPPPLCF